MKICCIGSSHTTAIRESLNQNMKNKINHEVTFFASYHGDFYPVTQKLEIKGQNIIPTNEYLKKSLKYTSKKHDYIDIVNYDLIILYGFMTVFFLDENKYTKNVLNLALNGIYQNFWWIQQFDELIKMIRKLTNKKIVIGLTPNLAKNWNDSKSIAKKGLYEKSFRVLKKHYDRYDNLVVVQQPTKTIEDEIFTFKEFNKSVKQIDIGQNTDEYQPDWDVSHMNGLYGDNWWKEFSKIKI